VNATVGRGAPVTAQRRNCQLNLDLVAPDLSYGAISTTFSGTAILDNGAKAVLKTTYYFSGRASLPRCSKMELT